MLLVTALFLVNDAYSRGGGGRGGQCFQCELRFGRTEQVFRQRVTEGSSAMEVQAGGTWRVDSAISIYAGRGGSDSGGGPVARGSFVGYFGATENPR